MFVKVADQYLNLSLVRQVLTTADGLELYAQDAVIPVTGEPAKYLREVLDGLHVTTVVGINSHLPVAK